MSFFFVSSSFATTTTPEINVNYLNSLTGPKVTWETATESDSDIVLINGAYYKYTYHKPDDYTETNTRLVKKLNDTDTQSVVFKDIAYINDYYARGGAIYSTYNSLMDDITGDFIKNHAQSTNYTTQGGAIYNAVNLYDITGNFINNYAHSEQGYAEGGAIYNSSGTIKNISGNFINNYAQSTNYTTQGGAIFNLAGNINVINSSFSGNYVDGNEVRGGAIFNGLSTAGSDAQQTFYNLGSMSIINSSFYNNYAKGKSAFGGAIYNLGYLNIVANEGNSIFSDNYVEIVNDDGSIFKQNEAIFNGIYGEINLTSINNGLIQFDDKISFAHNTVSYLERHGYKITKDVDDNYIVQSSDASKYLLMPIVE